MGFNPHAGKQIAGCRRSNSPNCSANELPASRPYRTFTGILLPEFAAIPNAGDKIIANGWPFEIVDRDGRRIDMVLATKSEAT